MTKIEAREKIQVAIKDYYKEQVERDNIDIMSIEPNYQNSVWIRFQVFIRRKHVKGLYDPKNDIMLGDF